MTSQSTTYDLIRAHPDKAIAIRAPEESPFSYQGLRQQIENTVEALNKFGIGRNDRVAIVLPNGPGMASAFVSISAGATTAPLNPDYRFDEFEFYLSDLNAKALLVEEGSDSPALQVAAEQGILILNLIASENGPAGQFELKSGQAEIDDKPQYEGYAQPEDIALVLHTSGTTSRPKIVPLTHSNICASAQNISETLALQPTDSCLNIMPLFHIHGLMAATLATLNSGGSVYCSPGFNAFKFYDWMKDASPTWYTAVPTMHQAIATRASRNLGVIQNTALRFIRSSSSSLPPQIMEQLEKIFGIPVIEAYAMTEASHQMTSNQLPPGLRKPGTVGIASGPEVTIMDEQSPRLLAQGEIGEVVIKGSNVTVGYENNPVANESSFPEGWFRTGDQGVLDENGYLTITGRLKEIINRGGEKISPREVDEVLLDHPAVQQVVTFAIPHEKLGEEVGAALVLNENSEISATELREFASTRLADFKIPRRIVFLDEIPKGATGKLQRIGLAEKLGLVA
jgi:acyl-CoA synthetase (AMP-forming)/AMP-acid ligase II